MNGKRTRDELIALLNDLYYDKLHCDKRRGLGNLTVKHRESTTSLPLAGVDIDARIEGRVADVRIVQQYKNDFAEHLEATYIFPMSGCASVNSFEMRINGRTVKGLIDERQAARKQYQEAINQGRQAALMEQERDDVFTINVGNIPPGESVSIVIEYTEKLQFFDDGCIEIRLPLVVAPRHCPGNQLDRPPVGDGFGVDTDRVPDASRISPPRLVDGFNPDLSLGISVDITTGKTNGDSADGTIVVEELACSQHAVKSTMKDGTMRISLARGNELMNRDFVLRWRIPTKNISIAAVSAENPAQEGERLAMLSMSAPRLGNEVKIKRDVVFLVDTSGSMSGEKIVSAKRACQFLLGSLGPDDRFAIDSFDHQSQWLNDDGALRSATEESRELAARYLANLTARGGTEIGAAIEEAVVCFEAAGKSESTPIIVLITDGQIGDESYALKAVSDRIKGIRVFCVGIDTAVNFGFLSRLSKLSGATASFVTPGDALEDALRQIARDIGTPILTDLAICGLDCTIVGNALTPKRVLDLFSGRTSDVFFTYRPGDKVEPRLLIEGKYQDGSRFSQEVLIHKAQIAGVARFWAKEMIGELEDEFRVCRGDTASLQAKIVGISKTFSVLSRFTAFTCVDNEEKTNDTGVVREIVQPVHNPSGWSIVSPVSQSSSIGSVNQGGLYGCAPGTAGGAWGVSSFGPSQDQDQGQSQNQNEGWGEPPMGGAWDACDSGSISGFAGGWGFAPPPARKSVSAGSNWAVPHQARNQSRLRRLGKQESKSEITGPLNRVSTAIEAYRDVWSKAWQQIENGLLPDPQTIEDAVKELLDALDDHPAGFQMSPLIRHLNSNSKSFVSALRAPNLTLPAIKAMRVQLHVGYEQAMVEALGVIEKALRKGSAFWESTV